MITTVSRSPLARAVRTKSAPSTSSTAVRVSRAIGPISTRPRVVAGRIRLGNPPSHTGPVRPVNGSKAHLKPTYWIRIRPMKNTGMETPATEQAMMTRSARRPRFTAASVPKARPLGTAISIAPSISSTVGPMVIASSSLTILLEMIERPRSPRSTRRMYSKNCTGIERSRPSSRRIAAMVSALASGPAMIIAGSAGTTCNRQKQRKRTPSKAGKEISRRWTICCPMRRQRTGKAMGNRASARAGVVQSPPWQPRFVRRARLLIMSEY